MNQNKIPPLDLRLFVFVLVAVISVFLNVRKIPEIFVTGNFVPLTPHYGRALQDYLEGERNNNASERDWLHVNGSC